MGFDQLLSCLAPWSQHRCVRLCDLFDLGASVQRQAGGYDGDVLTGRPAFLSSFLGYINKDLRCAVQIANAVSCLTGLGLNVDAIQS